MKLTYNKYYFQVHRKRIPLPKQSTNDTAGAKYPTDSGVTDLAGQRNPGSAFYPIAPRRVPMRPDAPLASLTYGQIGERGRLCRHRTCRGRSTWTPRKPRWGLCWRRHGCMKFSNGWRRILATMSLFVSAVLIGPIFNQSFLFRKVNRTISESITISYIFSVKNKLCMIFLKLICC